MNVTRRRMATFLAAVPLAAARTGVAQVTSTVQATAATTPEQRMAKANAEVRKVSDRLAQTEVPMAIEPAFTFRA